jgi:hypothetical protein
MRWNSPVGNNTVVTPADRTSSPMSTTETPAGATTSRAPPASVAHTSNVVASKETDDTASTTSEVDGATTSGPVTSPAMARWVTRTPLGTPVDPEVNMT